MADTASKEILASLEETASLPPIHHLPHWSRFEADRVVPAATALLDEVEAEFDALEASLEASWADDCEQEVFGWIQKPFRVAQLREFLEGVTRVAESG